MHEDVCRFISNAVYDGRLEPDSSNERQRLVWTARRTRHFAQQGFGFWP
jgi:superfamily I DNA and/or RNA helicase